MPNGGMESLAMPLAGDAYRNTENLALTHVIQLFAATWRKCRFRHVVKEFAAKIGVS